MPPPSSPSLPPAGPAPVPTGARSPVTNEEVEMTEAHLPSWSSKDFTHEPREGNGSPLQCSCLENPRDGGAWWAAVYGVTQSWTRLKRLSSSSSSSKALMDFFHSSVGKESCCNAGDLSSIPGLGRSPGEGNSYPLQYSGLENSIDYSTGSKRVEYD